MKRLEGKVAVITGGATGMGLAIARLFILEGAYVYMMGRRQHELNRAVEALGGNVTAVQGDISRLADVRRLYEIIQHHHRQVNIVVANAGVSAFLSLEATEDQFDQMFAINVKGTFFTVQQALPLLQDAERESPGDSSRGWNLRSRRRWGILLWYEQKPTRMPTTDQTSTQEDADVLAGTAPHRG